MVGITLGISSQMGAMHQPGAMSSNEGNALNLNSGKHQPSLPQNYVPIFSNCCIFYKAFAFWTANGCCFPKRLYNVFIVWGAHHGMSHDSSCISLWYHLVDKEAKVEWPHLGKVLPPQTGFMKISSSILTCNPSYPQRGRSWKKRPKGWPLYRRRRSAVCASCNFSRGCCGWTRIFDGLQSRPAMDSFATCRWWDFSIPPKKGYREFGHEFQVAEIWIWLKTSW